MRVLLDAVFFAEGELGGASEGVGGGAFGEVEVAEIDGDVLVRNDFGYDC